MNETNTTARLTPSVLNNLESLYAAVLIDDAAPAPRIVDFTKAEVSLTLNYVNAGVNAEDCAKIVDFGSTKFLIPAYFDYYIQQNGSI